MLKGLVWGSVGHTGLTHNISASGEASETVDEKRAREYVFGDIEAL